jgi:hypothetical protein
MSAIIRNTPSCLIPKDLFQEEKINEYWSVLNESSNLDSFGKDDLEQFFLVYPKSKQIDSIHEISLMYSSFREKFPNEMHAVCINVNEDGFNLLALREQRIAYTGYFQYAAPEDILYHISNLAQQIFSDISLVGFYYQQISPHILRLLNNYYNMIPF